MKYPELLDGAGIPGQNPEFKPTQHHQIESQQEELKLESQQQQQQETIPQVETPNFLEKPVPIRIPEQDLLNGY